MRGVAAEGHTTCSSSSPLLVSMPRAFLIIVIPAIYVYYVHTNILYSEGKALVLYIVHARTLRCLYIYVYVCVIIILASVRESFLAARTLKQHRYSAAGGSGAVPRRRGGWRSRCRGWYRKTSLPEGSAAAGHISFLIARITRVAASRKPIYIYVRYSLRGSCSVRSYISI